MSKWYVINTCGIVLFSLALVACIVVLVMNVTCGF